MASNIEIKARITEPDNVLRQAQDVSGSAGTVITQRDTFFNCRSGRLKLREFDDGTGQLISYHRPDAPEPTQSEYQIYPTHSPEVLRNTLLMTLGSVGEVKKKRHLFMSGRTRIHIDDVEGLGNFLELEVVLRPEDDKSAGIREAELLMDALGIEEDQLVRDAYIDMITAF